MTENLVGRKSIKSFQGGKCFTLNGIRFWRENQINFGEKSNDFGGGGEDIVLAGKSKSFLAGKCDDFGGGEINCLGGKPYSFLARESNDFGGKTFSFLAGKSNVFEWKSNAFGGKCKRI